MTTPTKNSAAAWDSSPRPGDAARPKAPPNAKKNWPTGMANTASPATSPSPPPTTTTSKTPAATSSTTPRKPTSSSPASGANKPKPSPGPCPSAEDCDEPPRRRRAVRHRGVAMKLTQPFSHPDGLLRPPAAHRATTAHLQAAYPFVAEGGLPCEQVYVGRDRYGSSFCYDPWQLYDAKIITGTNAVVVGQIGRGKSACVKT